MGRLLLLFIVLPAVELVLLIEIGRRLGSVETVALIVLTGIVGAALARSQGLQVLSRIQAEMAGGRLPADPLVDGLILLVAAALLVTPGVLTDAFGLLCLAPGFRRLLKAGPRPPASSRTKITRKIRARSASSPETPIRATVPV